MKPRLSIRSRVLVPLCGLMVLTTSARWVSYSQQATPPAPATTFTGQSSRMETTGMAMGRRRFEAGARSYWHTHPEGQLIFVEQGRARVQRKGEPIKDLAKGESDFTGANIPHWHGAAPDQFAVQASISFGGIGPWLDAVTDAEYLGRPAR